MDKKHTFCNCFWCVHGCGSPEIYEEAIKNFNEFINQKEHERRGRLLDMEAFWSEHEDAGDRD